MKATVDRLVLVSTPDDGNHVRFDIRQLQEFFAAEFLYESVDADQLRERIELIAGDAHWREVMHFLLSALIENNRKTELTVAIKVLENLNEGEEEDLRLLKKRLGRGAILAARLLQEGVLEQDRRIRQQFRKCLEPLTAFTDTELLKTLVEVNQPNSKAWLHNFLISSLKEKQYSENIGALIVLVQSLDSNDSKAEEVSQFILSSPIKYFSSLIASLNNRILEPSWRHKYYPVKTWFFKSIIQILLDPNWIHIQYKAFTVILELIKANEKKAIIIATELGLPKSQLKIFNVLVNPTEEIYDSSSEYKILEGNLMLNFTIENPDIAKIYTNIKDIKNVDCLPGILKVVYNIICLNQTKDVSIINNILSEANKNEDELHDAIMIHLGSFRFFDTDMSLKEKKVFFGQQDKNEFKNDYWLKEPYFKISRSQISLNIRNGTIANSQEFLNYFKEINDLYPLLGVSLFNQFILQRFDAKADKNFIDSKSKLSELVIKSLINHPKIIASFPESIGFLLTESTDKKTNIKFRSILQNLDDTPLSDLISDKSFYSFEMFFPSEYSLLPHIVHCLLSQIYIIRHIDNNLIREKMLEKTSNLIVEIAENVEVLEKASKNLQLTKNIRGAIAIMLLLHPDGNVTLDDIQKLLVKCYDPDSGTWYVKSIANCFCLLAREEQPAAQWIVNGLLEKIREDYESRICFQKLLSIWRENSYAPIQKANVQDKWLSETD